MSASSNKSSLSSTSKRTILPRPTARIEFKNLFLKFGELPFPSDTHITKEKSDAFEIPHGQLAEFFVIMNYQLHIVLEERNSLKKRVQELEDKTTETTKADTVSTLDTIIRKIDSVDTKLKFLATNGISQPSAKTNPNSYADAVKSNISATRSEQILVTRQAIFEEQQRPNREKSLIVSNVPIDVDGAIFVDSLCQINGIPSTSITYKQLTKNIAKSTTLLIQMDTKEHALQVKRNLIKLRVKDDIKFGKIRARPFYSTSEMARYRELWQQAIELNNLAKNYQWTVRNLHLIKQTHQKPWIYKPLDNQPSLDN